MSDEDRKDIKGHLETIEINNHNTISTLNQQIEINRNFRDTLRRLKDIATTDRHTFSSATALME